MICCSLSRRFLCRASSALASLALLFLLAAGCAPVRSITVAALPVAIAQVDDARLGYRVVGAGEPLLLIMGYAGTMDVWDGDLVARLARTRRVILFDNRGMGHSSGSEAPLTMEMMARDALGLMDVLGIRRADVMGWSMGSVIAQEMALTRPDAVGKLVLYGSACDPEPVRAALARFDTMSREQFAAALFPRVWTEANPSIYSRLPSPALPPSAQAVARQRAALDAWEGTRARLTSLSGPVLLVSGEDDAVTPVDQSLDMASLIPGAWLARFKGGGHWLMYQTPEGMASVIETFLSGRQDLLH
jgi:pimeloyl-ACP methyl ester carboxylesterase